MGELIYGESRGDKVPIRATGVRITGMAKKPAMKLIFSCALYLPDHSSSVFIIKYSAIGRLLQASVPYTVLMCVVFSFLSFLSLRFPLY